MSSLTDQQAIIFDLGGVLINLDYQATTRAFEQLGVTNFSAIYSQAKQSSLFDDFETGVISESVFFGQLAKLTDVKIPLDKMKMAWNAMLLDFPKLRLDKLLALKTTHRIFLLSNTNETHIHAFEAILQCDHGYSTLNPFFERCYYSNRIGLRKPDERIFEFVLSENHLDRGKTIFIDDSIQHVEGARKCGIRAYHLMPGEEVFDVLPTILNG